MTNQRNRFSASRHLSNATHHGCFIGPAADYRWQMERKLRIDRLLAIFKTKNGGALPFALWFDGVDRNHEGRRNNQHMGPEILQSMHELMNGMWLTDDTNVFLSREGAGHTNTEHPLVVRQDYFDHARTVAIGLPIGTRKKPANIVYSSINRATWSEKFPSSASFTQSVL